MSDKANWVGTTEIDDGNVQHTGTHRFSAGSNCVFADPTDATKTMIFDLSGLTTGTETIFTVPESDSSIVTLTATQTLTNKTLTAPTLNGGTWVATDSTFTIADNSTPTKIARFECASLTAGTNVFTLPNTAADTFVTLAANQTLTTKTLTAPTINAATLTGAIAGGALTPTSLAVLDNAFTVGDSGDPTKLLAFECSGISAATTRTVTIPNSNGTLAYLDGSTFTNAVLTAPTINAATLTGNITGGTVAPTTLTVPAGTALATPALTAPTVATSLLITSTTGALGVPVMTEAQRDALTPAAGWIVYNSTTNKLNVRVAAAWEVITSA